jgi:putative flippase GtrA
MKWLMNKLGVQNKTDLFKLLWQFFKFGLVGVSNTAVSLGVYYLVLWMNPELYMLGSVLGTILSIFNAFIWNDLFVFTGNPKDFKSVMKRLGKTYVSYGGTSALSTALLWVEVELLFVSELYAPIINLVITIPLNYLINKFWTFKSK